MISKVKNKRIDKYNKNSDLDIDNIKLRPKY